MLIKFNIDKYDIIPIIDINLFIKLCKKNKEFSYNRLDTIFNNYRITYYNNFIYNKPYDTKTLILTEILINKKKKSGGTYDSNEYYHFCMDNGNKDADVIKDYLNSDDKSIEIFDKYPKVKKIIDNSSKELKKIEVIIDSKVGYVSKSIYKYYDYNKDLVLAFEKNFIDNIENMNKYIHKQNIYLNSLSYDDKYVIFDYTNKISSSVYKKFKNNNKEWMEDIKNIGDAFLPQIYNVIGNDSNQKLPTIRNSNSKSLFDLDIKTWIKVLNTFTDDLDKIIRKSPKLEDDIYCYKGCANYDYNSGVYNDKDMFILKLFKFTIPIPSSFTLSYKVAKYYYDMKIGFPILLRTTIMKGCNALFISNIGDISEKYDFEIVIPSNSIIAKSDTSNWLYGINYNDNEDDNDNIGLCHTSKHKVSASDIIITSTEPKKEINTRLKLLLINKPISISKYNPDIIIFKKSNVELKYIKNIIKQLEYLGFMLIGNSDINYIFLKSHIFTITDVKIIEEKTAFLITLIYNNEEIKIGIFDKYDDIDIELDIIIENNIKFSNNKIESIIMY